MSLPFPGAPVDYAKIEAMVDRLAKAIEPKLPPAPTEDPIALRFEYQVAVDVIKLLSDIRFRCLVFVTSIAAVASALLPNTAVAGMRPALGILGLLATLGIAIYELRNSQLYETAIHRAKVLERRLGMQGSASEIRTAGLFDERPSYVRKNGGRLSFWLITVKHDYGLALIYGAALGAWAYLAIYGLLALPVPPAAPWPPQSEAWIRLVSAGIGLAIGAASTTMFAYHDKTRLKQPRPRPAPVAMRVDVVDSEKLSVQLSDGRSVSVPLNWYPPLVRGTPDERSEWKLLERGERIHWPTLRVSIRVEELLEGRRPVSAGGE